MPDSQSAFAPLFKNTEPTVVQPSQQEPAAGSMFSSPEYLAASQELAKPQISADEAKRIDALNEIRSKSSNDIAGMFENDDAAIVADYRKNRELYDSDPASKQKFLDAYKIARSQPFSVSSAIGGFASGVIHLVPSMVGSAVQVGKDVLTGKGDKVMQGTSYAIANTREDLSKAGTNLVRLATTLSTLPKDDTGWNSDFETALKRDEHLDHVAHGGPLLEYTDEEARDVEKNSLVADPLNFIPLEGGAGLIAKAVKGTTTGAKVFKIVNKAGQVLREIPVASKAGQMISAIGSTVRSAAEETALSTGSKIAEAGKSVGSLKASAAGGLIELAMNGVTHGIPGAGLVTGAVAPKTLELVGNGLVNTALKSKGVVPWGPLVSTAKTVAEHPVIQAAKSGAAGALGLHGDPLAAGFSAMSVLANADGDGSKIGQALGSNVALGVAGGIAGEATRKEGPKELPTIKELGADFAAKAPEFKEPVKTPTESASYGVFPGFDSLHEKNVASMAPEARDQINKFREQFRDKGAQIYVLSPEEYAQALLDHAEQQNAKNGPLSDEDAISVLRDQAATKGVFVSDLKGPDGKKNTVLLLNQDGSALGHETGHLVDSMLPTNEQVALRKQVRSSYSAEEIATAKDRYEQLLGQEISEPAVIDELIAENFSKMLAGVPIEEIGAPRAASAALQNALEKSYAKPTDLGFRADPQVGATLSKALAADKIEPKPLTAPATAPEIKPRAVEPTQVPIKPADRPTAPVIQPREASKNTNIRVTPEQQNEFSGKPRGAAPDNNGDTSARLALQDPKFGYKPTHVAAYDTISKNLGKPIEADYNSVKSEMFGADRLKRRLEQAMPESVRQQVQKIFVPYRTEVNAKGVQVLAMSLDKVRQNVETMVKELSSKNATDLSPYAIRDGKLSPSDAQSLIQDIQTYTKNQANGYAGNGQKVTVPQGYFGSIPAENPNFKPVKLAENKAQFINALMGRDLGPPKTARATANRPIPANVSARQLAEANGRPTEPALLANPGQEFSAKNGGGPIVETNPLRQQMVKRGVSVDGLHEVTERLTLKEVSNVKARPDLNFAQPATDLMRAGFMPDPQKPTRATNPEVAQVADEYMQSAGLPYQPHDGYSKMPEELGKRIADWFDKADSNPSDPAVQAAYRSLKDQVRGQYDAMVNAGYSIEPWSGKGEPYKSSADMVRDVKQNKHLWFFLTDNGFGSNEKFDVSKNPMLEPTGIKINGKELVANDLFRAVHDFFGHAKEGYEFGPRGEYNAFLAHSTMFEHSALPALGAETLAQNAWVNFGPHLRREDGSLPVKGDHDFKALNERPFADQKVTIVPENILRAALDNGLADRPEKGTKFMPATQEDRPRAKFLYEDRYKNLKGEEKTVRYYQTPGTPDNPRGLTVDEAGLRERGLEAEQSLLEKYPDLKNVPEGQIPIEIERANGTKQGGVMNGYYDLSIINKGMVPSVGVLDSGGGWTHGMLAPGDRIISEHPTPEQWEKDPRKPKFMPATKEMLTSNSNSDSDSNVTNDSSVGSKLEHAVGGQLRLVHLSGRSDIPKLLLSNFGDGMANSRDLRGLPKVYFFEEGSPLGQDAFWTEGKHAYGTKISGDKVYDGNSDPLGYWNIVNREERDQMLIDKGYDGLAVQTGDKRRVVTLFTDQDVTPLGKFEGGERIGSQLSFMPRTPEQTAVSEARARSRDYKERYPEALPIEFSKDAEGNIKLDKDGKPIVSKQSYDLYNTPLAKQAGKGIRNEVKKFDAIAQAYGDKIVQTYDSIKDRPDVMAGANWYRVARTKIKSVFGDDALLFAQLLGATSAQTPVADNFRQAIDAYRRFKNGDYKQMVEKYKEGLAKMDDGSLMKESGAKTEPAAMKWWVEQHNLVPTKSNGKRFNANSHAVLRVLAGNWADTVAGPKTPNFAGNLAGTTLEATIDVWAARLLHRVGSEQADKRWRILPDSETGVSDPDFYLGQAAYRKAAEKLGVNPDDLQAVMWFAEKDHWEKKGWTRGSGAEKSDFNYFLDRTKKEGDTAVLDEGGSKQVEMAL